MWLWTKQVPILHCFSVEEGGDLEETYEEEPYDEIPDETYDNGHQQRLQEEGGPAYDQEFPDASGETLDESEYFGEVTSEEGFEGEDASMVEENADAAEMGVNNDNIDIVDEFNSLDEGEEEETFQA